MRTLTATFAAGIALCATLLTAGCVVSGESEDYAKTFAVSGRPQVHVRVLDARVHVVTSDDPQVSFHVHYERWDNSSSAQPAAHQNGDVVDLVMDDESHDWWGMWGHWGTQGGVVEVRMPRNADLQVQTSNGAIEVSDLNGNAGLRTSNGSLRLTKLKGRLDAHTSNGSIDAQDVDGDCDVSSSNGRVNVAGRFDSLALHTSNGGVVARAESGSKVDSGWRIGTSNAGIELSLPGDLKADLEVGTSNAGVQLDLPVTVQGFQGKSHLHGTLNGGGPLVAVHSSNGRIHLTST